MEESPRFYNYHEYRQFNTQDPSKPLIITHFPNPYPASAIDLTKPTRVVRVPRLLTTDYPQFSNVLPGLEDGAIGSSTGQFEPKYEYEGHWFGTNSVSPLSNYLTPEKFTLIVDTVNKQMESQYKPSVFWLLYLLLDVLTLGLFKWLRIDKRPSRQLEKYVNDTNEELRSQNRQCRLVSPRLSGYLSLDFIVPDPRADLC